MLLTPRTIDLLVSTYQMRQLTREQLVRLHFATLAHRAHEWTSSVPGRILRRLVEHDFLTARTLPMTRPSGRPPLVYSLGARAVPTVAHALNLEFEVVAARQEKDTRLSWLFYPHRHSITDVRISLALAGEREGYRLLWYADEELAALKLQTKVNGKAAPIRPDAFLVVEAERRAPCFLELQLQSQPRAYLQKVTAYESYYASGGYTKRFGFQALRVLAVTDTFARAKNLHESLTHGVPPQLPELFWFTSLPQLMTNPFAPIWLVGGAREQQSLLGAVS